MDEWDGIKAQWAALERRRRWWVWRGRFMFMVAAGMTIALMVQQLYLQNWFVAILATLGGAGTTKVFIDADRIVRKPLPRPWDDFQ